MGLFRRLAAWGKSRQESQVRVDPAQNSRKCKFEEMESRRMLNASPVFVGAVYVEDDSGTDSQADYFYVSFQGGSSSTQLSRIVIDGNQDGNPNQLTEPDVYFDTVGNNAPNNNLGSGGAQPFAVVNPGIVVDKNRSIGITQDDVTWSVVDGGTRLVLDVKNFTAGDVLVFTIDVDQYFAGKDDDQITSGIEFAGSTLTTEFSDQHYNFSKVTSTTNGVFQYNFGFGSDEVAATGVLNQLPSKQYRTADNGLASIENRTAGAMEQVNLTPKPITISGTVYHDRDLNLVQGINDEAISGVTLRLQIKDSNGNYVDIPNNGQSFTTTTTDANGNYLFGTNLNLMPGTYRVVETQPVGFEYSVGEVLGTVNGSTVGLNAASPDNVLAEITIPLGGQNAIDYDFAEAKAAQLSGYVYHDRNNNGIKEAGEEGLSGVQLLVTPLTTISSQAAITVTTDANGFYSVTGLAPGTYNVIEVSQPAGYSDGLDTVGTVNGIKIGTVVNPGDQLSQIALQSAQAGINYNFGEIKYGSLSGKVQIVTEDGNCVEPTDPRYRPIANMLIRLTDQNGNVRTTYTDANGMYSFDNLAPGTYKVEELAPADFPYLDADTDVGTINGVAVGTVPVENTISQIVLGAGDNGINYDFCEVEPVSVNGYVYHDRNNNGLKENGEEGIQSVTLTLRDSNGTIVGTIQTDSNGFYSFTKLMPGTYTVTESHPTGWIDGKEAIGTVAGTPVGSLEGSDAIKQITLKPAQAGINYNFGEYKLGSIAGRVHADFNNNAIYEASLGDKVLPGVLVELRDSNGVPIRFAFTNAQGEYVFTDLQPGTYSVYEHQPDGYFHQDEKIGVFKGTTTVGPGTEIAVDTLGNITIGSDVHLDRYDFSEEPAGKISGYVYQDGATIQTANGTTLTPSQLLAQRNGQLTSDDTRLAGVWLELRNGLTGLPINASEAIPGTYPAGAIRVKTDANGFYEFKGLKSGNYAVFQVQPDGFTDHVDTPGTTSGIAINATDTINPLVLSTLAAGVNPNNDAILRIALSVGGNSQLNNFSEVKVEPQLPPPPQFPPVVVPPPRFTVGGFTPVSPFLYAGALPVAPQQPGLFGSRGIGNAWHLSVINGGVPRGEHEPGANGNSEFHTASYMSMERWTNVEMAFGEWELGQLDKDTQTPVGEVRIVTFGLPDGVPVTGDFNGDGTDEVAVFVNGEWFIDLNGNGEWDPEDLWAKLGKTGDQPVTGDWDNDGKTDIGIYGPQWPGDARAISLEPGLPDPENPPQSRMKNPPPKVEEATSGKRSLKLTAEGKTREDLIDHVFDYGGPTDVAIAGDWNGDGIRTIGTFAGGKWRLDVDGNGRISKADKSFEFGQAGDLPVVGDFNGDGIEEVGVYRKGTWIIDSNGNQTLDATDKVFEMGGRLDLPVVGDFNGDGIDDPGLYRQKSIGVESKAAG